MPQTGWIGNGDRILPDGLGQLHARGLPTISHNCISNAAEHLVLISEGFVADRPSEPVVPRTVPWPLS